ncbi:hypothetical protein QQY66_48480 [Streptomyces sp. DG2A-72]|nr:hypothetical protein [Streptomyces sp. DG2A-72]MDO0939164.1 hypothetical protein [Streptomyces sp. DG2A-72]
MAGKVFFSVSMSLDGCVAPESVPDDELFALDQRQDPDVQRWMAQWTELQQWAFPLRFFRENLKLGEGGEEGRDNDIAREMCERTGASVMGRRMFDLGEQSWPEEAPFHTPVFVVTHTKRDPWERPGGTTFHFVNDGIEHAFDQAREAEDRTGAGPFGAVVAGDAPDLRCAPTAAAPPLTPATRAPTAHTPESAGPQGRLRIAPHHLIHNWRLWLTRVRTTMISHASTAPGARCPFSGLPSPAGVTRASAARVRVWRPQALAAKSVKDHATP